MCTNRFDAVDDAIDHLENRQRNISQSIALMRIAVKTPSMRTHIDVSCEVRSDRILTGKQLPVIDMK